MDHELLRSDSGVQGNALSKSGHCTDRRRNGVVADQSLYSNGVEYQDDFERRRGRRGWGLGITVHGTVGPDIELPALALGRLSENMVLQLRTGEGYALDNYCCVIDFVASGICF
jgi:hypothetical protein